MEILYQKFILQFIIKSDFLWYFSIETFENTYSEILKWDFLLEIFP